MAPFVHKKFGNTTTFPLKVLDVKFARSHDYCQLQICDIVAGAARAWADYICIPRHDRKEYVNGLDSAGIEKILAGNLWPSMDFTPEELGTNDYNKNELLEYLNRELKGKI